LAERSIWSGGGPRRAAGRPSPRSSPGPGTAMRSSPRP